ncbi:hypothetical protein AU05_11600 [Ectopseudomonas composti]|uniref:SRPBCC family protein n=2 Tax=Ectopseudomonas composti TaxID=658457 RepID=A0ABN0SD09_9GAMM|nr:hypothetical protein AU05_11600 [Pseudomonas composti]
MRDFAAIERAGLAERVEMVGEGVGSCRHLHMAGGKVLVERLEARDESTMALTYAMTEPGPMPLDHYVATLQVRGDEHTCQVVFTADYEPRGITEEKANRMLSNVYRALVNTARTDLGLA